MIGVYVTVPVACFRKPLAREYLETEALPPPATCYGFLLSLVGEADRRAHIGARVTPMLLSAEPPSVVLRSVWRVKNRNARPSREGLAKAMKDRGHSPSSNVRPDYQQLLTHVELVVWLDSSEESSPPRAGRLEDRVRMALDPQRRREIDRFGGLSLGESTHMVDEVSLTKDDPQRTGRAFLLSGQGSLTLPVWVDHVGSAGTRYATGELVQTPRIPPDISRVPKIEAG